MLIGAQGLIFFLIWIFICLHFVHFCISYFAHIKFEKKIITFRIVKKFHLKSTHHELSLNCRGAWKYYISRFSQIQGYIWLISSYMCCDQRLCYISYRQITSAWDYHSDVIQSYLVCVILSTDMILHFRKIFDTVKSICVRCSL